MALVKATFTKHATEKFDLLRGFGFKISQRVVIGAISAPDRVEKKGYADVLDKGIGQGVRAQGGARRAQRHHSGDSILSCQDEEIWHIG